MKQHLLFTALFFYSSTVVFAQAGEQQKNEPELYKEIARLDSIVFDAFNRRDIEKFKLYFSEGLEFYHDKGGLTGYDHTIEFLESIAKTNNDLKRDLVKGSLEVYTVAGYGAIQIGSHRFCHTENNKPDCGVFQFVHIWQKRNDQWKITRVVSYDH